MTKRHWDNQLENCISSGKECTVTVLSRQVVLQIILYKSYSDTETLQEVLGSWENKGKNNQGAESVMQFRKPREKGPISNGARRLGPHLLDTVNRTFAEQ